MSVVQFKQDLEEIQNIRKKWLTLASYYFPKMFKDFKFFEISNTEGASSYVVYLTENHSKHLFVQSQL